MPVYYDSKKVIPVQFVSLEKEYQTSQDGTPVGTIWVITVQGTLVADKGSPNSSKVFWTSSGYPPDETIANDAMHASLIRKKEAIRELFANEGRSFEAQPWDGTAPFKCNPRVRNLRFPEGNWYNVLPYTITLEADLIYINGTASGEDSGDPIDYKVSSASEAWNIEPADEIQRTFRLTHNVSAVGKRFYDSSGSLTQEAWENAKDYVLSKITLGLVAARLEAEDVLDLTSFQAFNYVRSQQLNEMTGEFSVTETWLCFDPEGGEEAIEEYEVNTAAREGRTSVSISGTIRGLEQRNNSTYALQTSKWTNANAKWGDISSLLFSRAQTISGVTLNTVAINSSVGRNQDTGVVTYNYEYDNRPDPTFSGSLSESVNIHWRHPSAVFAIIPIIGRAAGPILQNIGTKTERVKTVTVEVVMPPKTQTISPGIYGPNTDGSVDTYMGTHIPSDASTYFISADEESWNELTGRYFRRMSFTWNKL